MRIVFLLVILGVSLAVTAQNAEVVIVSCTANATPMTVKAATGSSGAPAIAAGTNCAQALADLLTAGYLLHAADGARLGGTVIFTVAKPAVAVQCTDTFDNDGDGLTDGADPQCTGPTDSSEGS